MPVDVTLVRWLRSVSRCGDRLRLTRVWSQRGEMPRYVTLRNVSRDDLSLTTWSVHICYLGVKALDIVASDTEGTS